MKTKKMNLLKFNTLKLNKRIVSNITGGNEITDPEIDDSVGLEETKQEMTQRQCHATRNGCYISSNC